MFCVVCGKESGAGRYCRNACKQKAYRDRLNSEIVLTTRQRKTAFHNMVEAYNYVVGTPEEQQKVASLQFIDFVAYLLNTENDTVVDGQGIYHLLPS